MPPSKAAACGTAANEYIPTKANIRMAILIACFMGYSPSATWLPEMEVLGAEENYKARVKPLRKATRLWPESTVRLPQESSRQRHFVIVCKYSKSRSLTRGSQNEMGAVAGREGAAGG